MLIYATSQHVQRHRVEIVILPRGLGPNSRLVWSLVPDIIGQVRDQSLLLITITCENHRLGPDERLDKVKNVCPVGRVVSDLAKFVLNRRQRGVEIGRASCRESVCTYV